MGKKVVVGLSGGVDSSVAAYLLKQQGYEVVGLFMRNWDSLVNNDILGNPIPIDQCPQEKDWQDAQAVAAKLDIPIHRVDFVKEYWDLVFQYFIEEYQKGHTPNPDILCNKYIKFAKFQDYALKTLQADYIAMGHYAKVEEGHLYRAMDQDKDQTYFLAQLSHEQLARVLFPLANYTKSQIREIATEQGLITANKKDSTGICFIGERNFTQFLQNYIPSQPGAIIDITNGKQVGQHVGAMYYTLGQRKGLNLGGMSEPYYVAGNDLETKSIYVAPASQPQWLVSNRLLATNLTLNNDNYDPHNLTAKFRYRQQDVPVTIRIINHNEVIVDYPQGHDAVTPGQQVVLYDGEKCLGGATIAQVFAKYEAFDPNKQIENLKKSI